MRMNAFSCEFGDATFITSSSEVGLKFLVYQSRASRSRGSRRMSYSRNIKFTCSCVTSPMAPSSVLDRSNSIAALWLKFFGRSYAPGATIPALPFILRHFALQHDLMCMAQRNFRLFEPQLDPAPQFTRHVVLAIQYRPRLQPNYGAIQRKRFNPQHPRPINQRRGPIRIIPKISRDPLESRQRPPHHLRRRHRHVED